MQSKTCDRSSMSKKQKDQWKIYVADNFKRKRK